MSMILVDCPAIPRGKAMVTIPNASQITGVPASTLYRWANARRVPSRKSGTRVLLYQEWCEDFRDGKISWEHGNRKF